MISERRLPEQRVAPGGRGLTAARTGVLVVPSVAMALIAHVLSGGCLQLLGTGLVAVVLTTSTWTQLSRTRSPRFTLLWLTITQALAHRLLTFTCVDAGAAHARALLPSPAAVGLHALAVLACAYGCSRVDRWLCRAAQVAAVVGAAAGRVVTAARSAMPPYLTAVPRGSSWLPLLGVPPRSLQSLWAAAALQRRGPPLALLRR